MISLLIPEAAEDLESPEIMYKRSRVYIMHLYIWRRMMVSFYKLLERVSDLQKIKH